MHVYIVSCSVFIHTAPTNKPEINDFTTSPLQVEPSNQIILRADATGTTANIHAVWTHGNDTHDDPIAEDPFCQVRTK